MSSTYIVTRCCYLQSWNKRHHNKAFHSIYLQDLKLFLVSLGLHSTDVELNGWKSNRFGAIWWHSFLWNPGNMRNEKHLSRELQPRSNIRKNKIKSRHQENPSKLYWKELFLLHFSPMSKSLVCLWKEFKHFFMTKKVWLRGKNRDQKTLNMFLKTAQQNGWSKFPCCYFI